MSKPKVQTELEILNEINEKLGVNNSINPKINEIREI